MSQCVLLVAPPSDYPPMGTLYIAGALQSAGVRVELCRSDASHAEFVAALVVNRPQFVGFSVYTYPSITDMVEKTLIAKEMGYTTIWGGAHPTGLPEECSEIADFVVVGDGENDVINIVTGDPSGLGLDDITPAWNLVNPSNYIFPASHSVRGDSNVTGTEKVFYYLSTSRGCLHSCTFCYNSQEPKRTWRGHSFEWVKAQVDYLKQKTNMDGIGFWDDCFFADMPRAAQILNHLKDQGIKFLVEARASQLNSHFAEWLKDMGCLQVFVGAESGSNRVLNHIKKHTTVDEIMSAITTTCYHRLPIRLSFIYGFPGETREEMLKTKELIRFARTFPNVSISGPKLYTPYPGTAMYQEALDHGFVPPKTMAGWSRIHRDTDLKLLPWIDKDWVGEGLLDDN